MTVQRQIRNHENTRVPESATRGQDGVSGADQFDLASLTNIIKCHRNNKGKLFNDLRLYHLDYNIRRSICKINRIVQNTEPCGHHDSLVAEKDSLTWTN